MEDVNILSHKCMVGEGGMLPNYAPWCGLEPNGRRVTNYFW